MDSFNPSLRIREHPTAIVKSRHAAGQSFPLGCLLECRFLQTMADPAKFMKEKGLGVLSSEPP